MVEKKYIFNIVNRLKDGAKSEFKNENYDFSLQLISNCANILYETNQYYMDEELESLLYHIGKKIDLELLSENNKDVTFFYDGFGIDNRGLAQIYLKSLCKIKKVVYVTFDDRKEYIPETINILKKNNAKILFLDRKKNGIISQIKKLSEKINSVKPESIFFYSTPNDVVGTVILNAYENLVTRYQINLTDHAFWLGSKCIDKCIEFRDYGASISYNERKIPKEKIVKLPFYPIINEEKEFEGFPFPIKKGQRVIFSGGALYKTLGGDNKYYKIVDHILKKYDNTIFWYAGSGDDTELKKILVKYPDRAYHTNERSDLYQVLKHSRFYLSTYPICGGLMYQYAAKAGKVPITLKYDDCADGFLLNQNELNIEFFELEDLFEEIDKLLSNDEYYIDKGEKMVHSVITEQEFDSKMNAILCGQKGVRIDFSDINTRKFRHSYIERLTNTDIDVLLANKYTIKSGVKYVPVQILRGGGKKIIKKIRMMFQF